MSETLGELLLETGNAQDPFLITADLSTRSKELTFNGLRATLRVLGPDLAARFVIAPGTLLVRDV